MRIKDFFLPVSIIILNCMIAYQNVQINNLKHLIQHKKKVAPSLFKNIEESDKYLKNNVGDTLYYERGYFSTFATVAKNDTVKRVLIVNQRNPYDITLVNLEIFSYEQMLRSEKEMHN